MSPNILPSKKKKTVLLLTITVIVAFSVGLLVGKLEVTCKVCPPEEVDFSLFWEAWNKLHQKFVNPKEMDTQQMIYGAISGMVKSLGDPYTVFMTPEDSKKFLEDAAGRFEGVGMEVGIRKDILQIIAPLKGTPAEKAGLRAGDKIIKIGNILTTNLLIDEAVSLIRGPKGTEVTLTIYREGWDDTKEFTITRAVIEPPSVEWELKDLGDGKKAAYLKLYQFSEVADADFNVTAREILNSPADRIILDLRNNPGGYLEVAQDIAGWFLEKGEIVAIEDRGDGTARKEYQALGNSKLLRYPIVVLINEGSASGAEILAGALHDNHNITLIGKTSFGKGSVQQLENLRGGSSLKITVAKWLTPKGISISEVGLKPDVEVELTEKDFEEKKDPQLDKAIALIKELR